MWIRTTSITVRPPALTAALPTILIAVFLLSGAASAHPLAPSLLELEAREARRVDVTWKISVQNPEAALLEPRWPASCRTSGLPASGLSAVGGTPFERDGTALVRRFTMVCTEGLEGAEIRVDGLDRTDARVLLRLVLEDGRTTLAVLDSERPAFMVARRSTAAEVVASYLGLGFEHILGGYDHLLFVLGLLFLVRGRRALLGVITAFTLGHSVTLSLASLGLVRAPSAPIELAISVSIFFVAVEVARGAVRRPARLWRTAGFFGLLHGLGFAGALSEIGLPEGEIPLALVSFNTGIELGQLAFIAVVLGLTAALGRLPFAAGQGRPEARLALPAAYVIGALAFHACLSRLTDLWILY